MGLFSSSYKTVVGTSVVRAIKDDFLPDSVRTGVTKAIFENGDVSDYVLEELVSSIGVRADRAHEYAKRSYVHGLPSSDIVEASKGRPELIAVLSQMEGTTVSLEYSFFGRANFLHMGWLYLVAALGYDPSTNKIGAYSTVNVPDVYLHDLEICLPEAGADNYDQSSLRQWGTSPKAGKSPTRRVSGIGRLSTPTPIQVSPDIAAPSWRVRYAWETIEKGSGENGDSLLVHEDFKDYVMPTTFVDFTKDYFHVKYVVNGVTKYWMYAIGSGTYPSLDALFNVPPKVTGAFFPFLYFRYGKKSEISDKGTTAYKSTKRLAKYFSIDFDDVSKSIDENPDITDVEQAMMIMAIPANTENEVERKYLFTFFENWFYSKNAQYRSPATGAAASFQAGDANINVSSIIIQDKRFKMVLSCAGLYRRRVAGKIGEVGKHTSGITNEIIEIPAEKLETGEAHTITKTIKNHYYRRQVADNLYDEVLVSDLKMLYYVYGDYTSVGDDTDDILLVPLDKAICEEYSMIEKEVLYARSMHFVFNSRQVIKVKWYQKGWFAAIIQIVGLVIAVVTMQPQLVALAAGIGAGVSAAISAILALLQKLLVNFVIGVLFKIFVKIVGIDLAFLVAIVGTIYGMAGTLEGSPIRGAPWASDFLKLGNGLVKAVSQTVSDLMNGLGADMKAFQALKEESEKALEDANKLLETNNHLSPITIFGESPNDFYNRTVHSGNAGINAINAVTNYVDIALTLPKLNDTIGDTAYAT